MEQFRINVERTGADVTISVSDNGEGIPRDQHEYIFEKFGQTNSGRQHRHSTGLGLAFCQLAVKAHQGKIGVQSEPGKGSTFWFTLPTRDQSGANEMGNSQSTHFERIGQSNHPRTRGPHRLSRFGRTRIRRLTSRPPATFLPFNSFTLASIFPRLNSLIGTPVTTSTFPLFTRSERMRSSFSQRRNSPFEQSATLCQSFPGVSVVKERTVSITAFAADAADESPAL